MAITIVEGAVGDGKTYFAVWETLDVVAAGRYVYTNIEMVIPAVRERLRLKHGVEFNRDQIRRLPRAEEVRSWVQFIEWGTLDDPVLVIIDEAQMFYNSREWDKTQKAESETHMLSFLTQSRKAGVDVIFITQDAGNVDKQFRVLAHSIVCARKMAHIRFPILGIPLVGLFLYKFTQVKSNFVYRKIWRFAHKPIFQCYETAAMLDSNMQEMEENKIRLEPLKLRKTSWLRKLIITCEGGDWIEQEIAKYLRRWEAGRILKQRNESNPDISSSSRPDLHGLHVVGESVQQGRGNRKRRWWNRFSRRDRNRDRDSSGTGAGTAGQQRASRETRQAGSDSDGSDEQGRVEIGNELEPAGRG